MMRKAMLVLLCAFVPVQALAQGITMRATPCRLFDSRNIGGAGMGSKINAASIETYGAAGDVQGGQADCGVPHTASAVVLNLVVFQPDSGGWARMWACGATEPLSTSVNAFLGSANEATGLLVKLGTDGKISLNASITAAHYVIDLSGYIDGGGEAGFQAPRLRRFRYVVTYPFLPGTLEAGDRFLVSPSGAVGDFYGHGNEWAYWTGAAWVFEPPADGDLGYAWAEGIYYRYKGSGTPQWDSLSMSGSPLN